MGSWNDAVLVLCYIITVVVLSFACYYAHEEKNLPRVLLYGITAVLVVVAFFIAFWDKLEFVPVFG
jgi:hypothetical protein